MKPPDLREFNFKKLIISSLHKLHIHFQTFERITNLSNDFVSIQKLNFLQVKRQGLS